jgi:hypothetical protein
LISLIFALLVPVIWRLVSSVPAALSAVEALTSAASPGLSPSAGARFFDEKIIQNREGFFVERRLTLSEIEQQVRDTA